MYNRVIFRISPWSVFRILFLAGAAVFGLGGILPGLLAKDILEILGGAALGLMAGLWTAVIGAVYCAVFNLLAPAVGGIMVETAAIEEQPLPAERTDKADSVAF